MRNRILKSFTASAVCLVALLLAAPIYGQSYGQWQESDRYGRWGRGSDVGRLIRQAETRSDQFARVLEQTRNGGFFQRVFREDRTSELTARAHHLEAQLNAVRDEFNRDGNSYELRSRIANALSVAESIDRTMRYRRMNSSVERQWTLLRSDLNRLARAYNLEQVG